LTRGFQFTAESKGQDVSRNNWPSINLSIYRRVKGARRVTQQLAFNKWLLSLPWTVTFVVIRQPVVTFQYLV